MWMNKEVDTKLLTLIKYTDSEGKVKRFNLLREIQGDCTRLGSILGIDEDTLTASENSKDNQEQVCKNILVDKWLKRGEGGYDATWAGLLEALEDASLGGVAKKLNETLKLHFK